MVKIVINGEYGGFDLSHEAIMLYAKLKGINLVTEKSNSSLFDYHYYVGEIKGENYFSDRDIPRDDPVLVEVVERLGEAASGSYSAIKVVEIPDDVNWYIEEYDGNEWVAERHRTWR